MGASARTDVRALDAGEIAALEQEVLALRQEVYLLKLANEELERLVVRDTLTPLYNRRHFGHSLNDKLSRLERYGAQTALIFIDVDSMKQINDVYGHSAGDFALIRIAEIITSAIRSTDIAARVGGDEFALLLDGLDEPAAQEKMHLLCAMIAEAKCMFDGKLLPLSISAGCTALRLGDNDFSAIARADMAMYAAKRPAADLLPDCPQLAKE